MNDKYPRWLPFSAYVAVYHTDPDRKTEPQEIFNQALGAFEVREATDQRKLKSDQVTGYTKIFSENSSIAFLVATGPSEFKKDILNSTPSLEEHSRSIQSVEKLLPEKPESSCHMRFLYSRNEDEALDLLQTYMRRGNENADRHPRSVGLVKGCLLATLEGPDMDSAWTLPQEIVILPYQCADEMACHTTWTLCFEICRLAMNEGRIRYLYRERKPMLGQIDASENSTQLRINEILMEMRRPIDEIKPADLESILKDITIQFSRLSTLTSAMRRDYVKAKSILRSTRHLVGGWSERALPGRPLNSSTQIENLQSMIAPFRDFIQRTEALTGQFDTVLDSVRTYLGIHQQKMSIAEQTSSREQLVRLVNLQETLHKLEILVVAVYLTEMARIVFETLLHEQADILTVVFIPIALVTSILLGRILHKKEE